MSQKNSYPPRLADITLGQKLKKLRITAGLSQMQLGRKTNDLCQQIDRYEAGAFIPLPKLEDLSANLGRPIAKKIIRKISTQRKLQNETGLERSVELIMLYNEALGEDLELS